MDFGLTDTQQEIAGLVRQICEEHLTQARRRTVEAQLVHLDDELWAKVVTAGIVSAGIAESAGGGGLDVTEQVSILLELGRAIAPVPFLHGVFAAGSAIAEYGSADQQAAWLTPILDGSLIATAALTEELNDSPEYPTTRADRVADAWVLTGVKAVVPYGPVAGLFLVPATTDAGVRVFAVTPADAGVGLTTQIVTDGDAESTLELSAVSLGDDRLLGGADVLSFLITRTTLGTSALQLGVIEKALELTAEYARTREQFGRAIGSFQAVAQRLADAYIDVEGTRLTVWEAAWRVSEGLPAANELATAKFWAADAGHRVAHTAVHVHGGMGIDVDGPLHRYFVAAKRNEFALGSATAQLRRIGADLAATPA